MLDLSLLLFTIYTSHHLYNYLYLYLYLLHHSVLRIFLSSSVTSPALLLASNTALSPHPNSIFHLLPTPSPPPRCRPPSKKEIEQYGSEAQCVSFPQPNEVAVFNQEKNREKSWEFDEVFDVNSTQDSVYRGEYLVKALLI